jgi:hypothetical protein
MAFQTPNGLWLSVTGNEDWEQYCLRNNYPLENLESEFQVFLKPTAKILILYNSPVFEDFIKKYGYFTEGIQNEGDILPLNLSISWDRIISDYQGMVIPTVLPKISKMNLWNEIWYYTSGCIWDLRAVEKAEKLI